MADIYASLECRKHCTNCGLDATSATDHCPMMILSMRRSGSAAPQSN